MKLIRESYEIARKDLILELRGKEIVLTMILFGMVILLIFNFAIDFTVFDMKKIAGGILWISFIFSGSISINRSFTRELEDHAIYGLVVAPIDRAAIFIGKSFASWIVMLIGISTLIPIFILLFNINIMGSFFEQLMIILLGSFGFVTVSSLVSASLLLVKSKDLLAPLLSLPLLSPVVISASKISTGLILSESFSDLLIWYQVVIVFDFLYFVAGWLIFEYIISE